MGSECHAFTCFWKVSIRRIRGMVCFAAHLESSVILAASASCWKAAEGRLLASREDTLACT